MSANKRGQAELAIDWFIALIFTLLLFIILVIMVSAFETKEVETGSLSASAFVFKTYYGPEIFAPEGVLRFGAIDEQKFTAEHLDRANEYPQDHLAARLTLTNLETGEEQTITHNEQFFEARYPLAANEVRGAGGARLFEREYPVRIYEDDDIMQGLLGFEVVVSDE